MKDIQQFLRGMRGRILFHHGLKLGVRFSLLILAYLGLYGLAVLLIKSFSLTFWGLILLPIPAVLCGSALWLKLLWQLRRQRDVATYLENRFEGLGLLLRSALDFSLQPALSNEPGLREGFLQRVQNRIADFHYREPLGQRWFAAFSIALLFNLVLWGGWGKQIRSKYYNPTLDIGTTHLDLNEGSITIFEPDYTQIPGRTLPLKPGSFQAYSGSRIRFLIATPAGTNHLYLQEIKPTADKKADSTESNAEQPTPLRAESDGQFSYEFILAKPRDLQFLVEDARGGARSGTYHFESKLDEIPQLLIRFNTPEGEINPQDPLFFEVEAKDDFMVKELEAVVSFKGGEKRMKLGVPAGNANHFLQKAQWFVTDLGVEKADEFTLHFEARDNNPIDGPGVGKSDSLTYQLETPQKKYDEFMTLARQLLEEMTNTLGDNLDTNIEKPLNQNRFSDMQAYSGRIKQGLENSYEISALLTSRVRETPSLSRLDLNFLMSFRDNVGNQSRLRRSLNEALSRFNWSMPRLGDRLSEISNRHRGEENELTRLTYDLLLQLKLWAVLDLERRENQLDQQLDDMKELLDKSDQMEDKELMEQLERMMQEMMREFADMMQTAAEQMDMDMDEFMNSEEMQNVDSDMQDLLKQIKDALAKGDKEKAKKLMEELREQMRKAAQAMRKQIGEMSPEMQAMMKQMREFMGLLKELRLQEEALAKDTQNLKRELDQKLGGNTMDFSKEERQKALDLLTQVQQMLNALYNRMVNLKSDSLSQNLNDQLEKVSAQLSQPDLKESERARLSDELTRLQRMLDFMGQEGLDQLKSQTLSQLEQVETLRQYMEQGEVMLVKRAALTLLSGLRAAESASERSLSSSADAQIRAAETYRKAGDLIELLKNAMEYQENMAEFKRKESMERSKEKRQFEQAQRQDALHKMMDSFLEKNQEIARQQEIMDRMSDIGQSMREAQAGLESSRLGSGYRAEQDVIQKLGDLIEQMEQSQEPMNRPGGMQRFSMGSGNSGTGQNGNPIQDINIPESQRKAGKDALKEAIRKQLGKTPPESYGKEIRKYYEKIMDQ